MHMHIEGDGLDRLREAAEALAGPQAQSALRRALNHTNDRAYTHVIRRVGPQVGLRPAQVKKFAVIRKHRAVGATLEASIVGTGSAVPLKEFRAKQFSYGVRAYPFGRATKFPGHFIFAGTPNSNKFVRGGNAFHRLSKRSHPIQMDRGPAVPPEMVRGDTAEAWQGVARSLVPRALHEVTAITRGVVS